MPLTASARWRTARHRRRTATAFEDSKDRPDGSTLERGKRWCAARSPDTGASCPAVAMRVDASYRMRVDEIVGAVTEAGAKTGHDRVEVLALDDPDLLRTAKTDGVAFYPWRPR